MKAPARRNLKSKEGSISIDCFDDEDRVSQQQECKIEFCSKPHDLLENCTHIYFNAVEWRNFVSLDSSLHFDTHYDNLTYTVPFSAIVIKI